jgi:predicted RNase H-like nuclease
MSRIERFVGVDLAWAEGQAGRPANESGVAALDRAGRVVDAGWTRGLDDTVAWIAATTADQPALLFVDAPPPVENPTGQRPCETQVGQRYGRWRVSANTSNLGSRHLAGVTLLRRLQGLGWSYADGQQRPARDRSVFECHPYTTLVGVAELGYDVERPRYKRKPRAVRPAEWRPVRAAACDDLLVRLTGLRAADPPLQFDSHPATRALLEEPSPARDVPYKHREDLIDAVLCAWTAALWDRHGTARCQVLGLPATAGPAATIIAPARPEQRRPLGSGHA